MFSGPATYFADEPPHRAGRRDDQPEMGNRPLQVGAHAPRDIHFVDLLASCLRAARSQRRGLATLLTAQTLR
jgi:hypothetical protein